MYVPLRFNHKHFCSKWLPLQFIYSEKARMFCEISTVDLSYLVPVKPTVEILQSFVTFSEYMNFIYRVCSTRIFRIQYIFRKHTQFRMAAFWNFINRLCNAIILTLWWQLWTEYTTSQLWSQLWWENTQNTDKTVLFYSIFFKHNVSILNWKICFPHGTRLVRYTVYTLGQ